MTAETLLTRQISPETLDRGALRRRAQAVEDSVFGLQIVRDAATSGHIAICVVWPQKKVLVNRKMKLCPWRDSNPQPFP